jgi:hypothetical protein
MRKLADDWPVIFAAGVALWFALTALHSTGFSFAHHDDTTGSISSDVDTVGDSSSGSHTSTKPTADAIVVGPLKIKVAAFSISPNKKDPGTATAEITLELRNAGKENVNFYPSQVALQNVDEGTGPAGPKESVVMGVSPNLAVTAPVTFTVSPEPAATYQLSYAGHTLYTGAAY